MSVVTAGSAADAGTEKLAAKGAARPAISRTVKLVRWVMRDDAHAELARRAAAVLAEIREGERRDEINKRAVEKVFLRVCGRGRTR